MHDIPEVRLIRNAVEVENIHSPALSPSSMCKILRTEVLGVASRILGDQLNHSEIGVELQSKRP